MSRKYKSQLRAFLCFCIYFCYTGVPCKTMVILHYIVFFANSIGPQSIPNCLNVIQIINLQAVCSNPLEDEFLHFSYHQFLCGIKRTLGYQVKQKLSIMPAILLQMYCHLNISQPEDSMFCAICLTAFSLILSQSQPPYSVLGQV